MRQGCEGRWSKCGALHGALVQPAWQAPADESSLREVHSPRRVALGMPAADLAGDWDVGSAS